MGRRVQSHAGRDLCGQFRIPPTVRMGPCGFTIDGVFAKPGLPLLVDEFRISTYQVGLSLPAGRTPGANGSKDTWRDVFQRASRP